MQLQQIVERCQQGDREAIAQLYVAMRKPLHGICLHYVKNETVAEDLLQDVFLHIFDKIGLLKDPSRAEAWMTVLAQRMALQHLRQQRQEQQQLSTYALKADRPRTEAPQAESVLAAKEIMAAIDALPKGYRRVFTLAVLEGKTHQEISKLLNIEPHSSSSQFYHARMLLRRWLRPLVLVLLAIGVPVGIVRWQSLQNVEETAEAGSGRAGGKEETAIEAPPTERAIVAQEKAPERKRPVMVEERTAPVQEEVVAEEQHNREHVEEQKEGPEKTEIIELEELIDRGEDIIPINTEHHRWSVELACNGIVGGGSDLSLPYANAETNPTVYDSVSHHRLPLTVALSVNYRLDKHWQVGTGLVYTRQTSDFSKGNSYVSLQQQQTVQQLGIPVSISYHWPLSRRLEVYGSAGITLHIPLRSTLDSHYLFHDGTAGYFSTTRLHPGLQWSAGVGAGLQYNFSPQVSFFVEPSLHHYFPTSGSVSTWTTEHSLAPSLPFGLRISF